MPQSTNGGPAGTSPLQGVLLALLLDERERELSGYRLTTLLARRLGPAWDVQRQSVYRALNQLEAEELVRSSERMSTASGNARNGQRVFRATARAEAVRTAWIESVASKEPVRDELHAKIAVSRAQDAPSLLRALDSYERSCFALLRQSGEAEIPVGSWASLSMNLARAAVDEGIQADLRWISKARAWIKDYADEHRGPR